MGHIDGKKLPKVNDQISNFADSEILQAIQSSALGGAAIGAVFQSIDLIKGRTNFGESGKIRVKDLIR